MMAYTSARYDDNPMTGSVRPLAVSELRAQDFSFSPSDSQEARIDWVSLSAYMVCSLSVGIPVALADCLRFPSDQSREESRLRDCHPGDVQPHTRAEVHKARVSPAGHAGQDLAVIEKPGTDKSPPDEQPWK